MCVSSGVYTGKLNKNLLLDMNITTISSCINRIVSVIGLYDSSNQTESVVLDCEGSGFGMHFTGLSHVTLQGFTIRNCTAYIGSALQCANVTSVHLMSCVFINNIALQPPPQLNPNVITIFIDIAKP